MVYFRNYVMGAPVSKPIRPVEVKEPRPTVAILEASEIQPPRNVIVNDGYIEDWGNNSQDIMWDVTFHSVGKFSVAIGISNKENHALAEIEVEINSAILRLVIPPNMYYRECTKILMGTLSVTTTGFSILRIRSKEQRRGAVGRLYFLELSGPAIENLNNHSWNSSQPLMASNVYLAWHARSSIDMFYNEMNVTDLNTDAVFIACGFYRGYIGLQEGKVIFVIENVSVNMPEDRIPIRFKVKTVQKMQGTHIEYYNGQTKASCAFPYRWQTNVTYRFLLTAKKSSIENSVFYSAFFYQNETKKWLFLATFKVTDMLRIFAELYSSIEDCESYHGFNNYEATYGPAFVHMRGKSWVQLIKTQFQRIEDRDEATDVNAGVTEKNKFFLSTGQPTKRMIPLDQSLTCQISDLPECLKGFDLDDFISLKIKNHLGLLH